MKETNEVVFTWKIEVKKDGKFCSESTGQIQDFSRIMGEITNQLVNGFNGEYNPFTTKN